MPPACADRSGHIDTVVWGIIPLRDASEPTHGHLLIYVVRVFVEGEAVCDFFVRLRYGSEGSGVCLAYLDCVSYRGFFVCLESEATGGAAAETATLCSFCVRSVRLNYEPCVFELGRTDAKEPELLQSDSEARVERSAHLRRSSRRGEALWSRAERQFHVRYQP